MRKTDFVVAQRARSLDRGAAADARNRADGRRSGHQDRRRSAGKITLKHGPIKKLDMDEAMTMVFRVQDPAMLKQVKVGDKVKFEADRVNGQITVTKIEKSK